MIVSFMHLLFKKQFETPKEAISRYIDEGRLPDGHAYTYAGRLDPLASGILPILDESSLSEKEQILALPKTYEVEVLFGVCTDSFDVLGLIYSSEVFMNWHTLVPVSRPLSEDNASTGDFDPKDIHSVDDSRWQRYVQTLKGKYVQSYPFFSSKPVDGVPLFEYTKLHGIEKTNQVLPTKEVEIFDINYLGQKKLSIDELQKYTEEVLMNCKGDFRQDEVTKSWEGYFDNMQKNEITNSKILQIATFKLTVSSGFYVRSFSCWLGQKIGCGALAYSIKRVGIGEYTEKDII